MSDLVDQSIPPGTGALLVGRYRLVERVGSGGMGRVYRARDEILGRDVALKIFHNDGIEPADEHRKISEAKVLASLNHPSLVTLYDAHIEPGEHAFLVMEFIEGPTLRSRLHDGPIAPADAIAMTRDLAAALDVVHAAGIVHRDIKPANVMLRPPTGTGRSFRAVLADFGIAHLVDATRHTSPGTVIGTAAYLAPEQVRGEAPVAASDIYAFGLLLIEALTGRHPFGEGSMQETLLARLARQPDVPGSLGYEWKSLLTAMTAQEPAARPTAAEVAERAGMLGAAGLADGPATAASTAATPLPATDPTVVLPVAGAVPTVAIAAAPTPPPLPPTRAGARVAASPRRGRRIGMLSAAAVAIVLALGLGGWALSSGMMAPAPATQPLPSQTTQPEPSEPAVPVDAEDAVAETDPTVSDDDSSTTVETGSDPAQQVPVEQTPAEQVPAEQTPVTDDSSGPGPAAPTDDSTGPDDGGPAGNSGPGNSNGKKPKG